MSEREQRVVVGHVVLIGHPGKPARVALCRHCQRSVVQYSNIQSEDRFVHDLDGGPKVIVHTAIPAPMS